MIKFFRFLFFSKNKATYFSLAFTSKTTARRVYNLAHGKRARNSTDYKILRQLKERGIIERIV